MYSSPRTYLIAALALVSPATADWADEDPQAGKLLKLAGEYHASGVPVNVFANILNLSAQKLVSL